MIDETTGPDERNAGPEGQTGAGERVAFCQQCGKGLTNETIRRVGSAVYCEPCLVARLEGAAAGTAQTGWIPGAAHPLRGPRDSRPDLRYPMSLAPWLAAFLA